MIPMNDKLLFFVTIKHKQAVEHALQINPIH